MGCFCPASTIASPTSKRSWISSINIVLVVDEAFIYIKGHRPFKINMALSPKTIAELTSHS